MRVEPSRAYVGAESESEKTGADMTTTFNAPTEGRPLGRGPEMAEKERPGEKAAIHRVLLVEDHASFRQAMALVFGGEPDFGPVSEAGSLAKARRKRASGFDLVVVDLGLPDGDATAFIQTLKEESHPPTVLVLTADLDRERHALAVEAGADGVIHKSAEIEEVLDSARGLLAGESILSPEETVALLRLATRKRGRDGEARLAARSLTRREREVLAALADGLSKKGIAKKLCIAVETEHTHMTNIFDKLSVHTRLEALLFAVREGVVEIKGAKK